MTLNATIGSSEANSYVDLAGADSIAATLPGGDDWLTKTDAEREESLVYATLWLETLDYKGTRCNPSTDDDDKPQRLKWPRSGATCDGVESTCAFIPYEMQRAEVALAIQYTLNSANFPGVGGGSQAPTGTYVKRQKLDVLEIEYDQFNNATASECDTCGDPAIISAFPWLKDLLGCWVGGLGPNREIRLLRN